MHSKSFVFVRPLGGLVREGFVKELFYNAVGTVYVVGLLHLAADVGGEGMNRLCCVKYEARSGRGLVTFRL